MTPELSPAQYLLLKTDIESPANAVFLGAFIAAIDDESIASWYNQLAIPAWWGMRTRVSKADYLFAPGPEGTTFAFNGAGFITRSVGERDAWREIFSLDGTCDPSLPRIQQAFQDIFSGGTAPAPANRAHLQAVSRRQVTRAERLFITAGTGTTLDPSTLSAQGVLTYLEVARALRNVGV
jgi:hypothetical protein